MRVLGTRGPVFKSPYPDKFLKMKNLNESIPKEYEDIDYLGEHLFDEFLFKNGFTEENVSGEAVEHFYSNVFHTVFEPSINGYLFHLRCKK